MLRRHGNAPSEETGPTPLQWFLRELELIPDGDLTKRRIRALLRRMVGQRIFVTRRELQKPEHSRMVRDMLQSGMNASQVRCALQVRLRISKATAQRLVAAALANPGGGNGHAD